jgi:hypothetical protein
MADLYEEDPRVRYPTVAESPRGLSSTEFNADVFSQGPGWMSSFDAPPPAPTQTYNPDGTFVDPTLAGTSPPGTLLNPNVPGFAGGGALPEQTFMNDPYYQRIQALKQEFGGEQFWTDAGIENFANRVLGITHKNLRTGMSGQQILNQSFGAGGGVQGQALGISEPGGGFTPFYGEGATNPFQAEIAKRLGYKQINQIGDGPVSVDRVTGKVIPGLRETPQQQLLRGVAPPLTPQEQQQKFVSDAMGVIFELFGFQGANDLLTEAMQGADLTSILGTGQATFQRGGS